MEDHTHEDLTALIGDVTELLQETQTELIAIAERQQLTMETLQDAIPGLLIALGVIVGVLLVSIFSGGMRNAS